ncbi:hypothetical protein D806_040020 [Mycolicibacterium smegmatis MKD8]|uniref:Uncharacterized protein n=1 Tax=Mycolicibacterium smegmatis (strain MKD8) TaxID=1214915 RepID=A0A2U9PTA2_MYCSE|nr:hypothetical protein D806_040020 [Mycolicibacterium smegmatis MKD8]
MRRKDDQRFGGDFVEFLNEYRTTGLQVGHYMSVVHNLLSHIHGRPVMGQGMFDDVDRAFHAGAEGPRGGEQDLACVWCFTRIHGVALPMTSDCIRVRQVPRAQPQQQD